MPGSRSAFGESSTTNNLKPPKLLIRTLLHVSSHTCKHMYNWPVFTIKLLINISLSINIVTKFMECIASNWGYRLYSNNNFLLSPCFLQPPHANLMTFKTGKWKSCRTHACIEFYSSIYLDCHTEIFINRNTTLRNLNTDIRKVRHNTGQFRTHCSTSWKGERLWTPDCSKWRNCWFCTNSLCKWEKPLGNCWSFCMIIKIVVEIASLSCVLKYSNNKVSPNRCHYDIYASQNKVCNNKVITKKLFYIKMHCRLQVTVIQ